MYVLELVRCRPKMQFGGGLTVELYLTFRLRPGTQRIHPYQQIFLLSCRAPKYHRFPGRSASGTRLYHAGDRPRIFLDTCGRRATCTHLIPASCHSNNHHCILYRRPSGTRPYRASCCPSSRRDTWLHQPIRRHPDHVSWPSDSHPHSSCRPATPLYLVPLAYLQPTSPCSWLPQRSDTRHDRVPCR